MKNDSEFSFKNYKGNQIEEDVISVKSNLDANNYIYYIETLEKNIKYLN